MLVIITAFNKLNRRARLFFTALSVHWLYPLISVLKLSSGRQLGALPMKIPSWHGAAAFTQKLPGPFKSTTY